MQAIRAAVGDGALNDHSDVALVQAMLVKIERAPSPGQPPRPYLDAYDGTCGNKTKAAIRAFQFERVFVSPAGNQSMPNPHATAGQVRPGDATWSRLVQSLPAEFVDMRVLAGGRIVYLQATANDVQARLQAANSMAFTLAFLVKVRSCINQVYAQHGIALGVCPQGDRRSFQAQYNLWLQGPAITNAGPGESNHNYGMAVDIGFAGLRWLHSNGSVDANETPWLHHLTAYKPAEALVFWETMRSVGTSAAVGAFRGPLADRPHLQNWNDNNVSMGARLAVLLQASGTMRWSYAHPNYSSDLGLGGAQFPVGTAAQIWNLQPTLALVVLNQARNAAAATRGKPPPTAATAADLDAMRQLLRQQFERADANWQNWAPN
jgi:hypothetical protein